MGFPTKRSQLVLESKERTSRKSDDLAPLVNDLDRIDSHRVDDDDDAEEVSPTTTGCSFKTAALTLPRLSLRYQSNLSAGEDDDDDEEEESSPFSPDGDDDDDDDDESL